jgi:hypothetical protein
VLQRQHCAGVQHRLPRSTNGNVIKKELSFWEVYVKGTYNVNDQVSFGAAAFYSPSVANSGADGTYVSSGAKFTVSRSAMPEGWGLFLYGEVGHWILGRSDNFYCTQVDFPGCTTPFPHGIPYPSYTTWNIGISITKSVFTLDLRYYDTDLRKGECNSRAIIRRASRRASARSIRVASVRTGAARRLLRPPSSI